MKADFQKKSQQLKTLLREKETKQTQIAQQLTAAIIKSQEPN